MISATGYDVMPTLSARHPPCRVCSGRGTGVHYGVTTCEACKYFFGRRIRQHKPPRCRAYGTCIVQAATSCCAACRFRKCLDVGMSLSGVRLGRNTYIQVTAAIEEVKKLELQKKINVDGTLRTPQQHLMEMEQIVHRLTDVHLKNTPHSNAFFSSVLHHEQMFVEERQLKDKWFGPRGIICRSQYREIYELTRLDVDGRLGNVTYIATLMHHMLSCFLQFANAIPAYRMLSKNDQRALIKAGIHDASTILYLNMYNTHLGTFVLPWAPHVVTKLTDMLAFSDQLPQGTTHDSNTNRHQPENTSIGFKSSGIRIQNRRVNEQRFTDFSSNISDCRLTETSSRDYLMDQNAIDQNVIDETVTDQNVMDQNAIDNHIMDQYVIDETAMEQNEINQKLMDQTVIDQDVTDQNAIDPDVMDQDADSRMNTTDCHITKCDRMQSSTDLDCGDGGASSSDRGTSQAHRSCIGDRSRNDTYTGGLSLIDKLQQMDLTTQELATTAALCLLLTDTDLSPMGRNIVSAGADYVSEALLHLINQNHESEDQTYGKIISALTEMRIVMRESKTISRNWLQDAMSMGGVKQEWMGEFAAD